MSSIVARKMTAKCLYFHRIELKKKHEAYLNKPLLISSHRASHRISVPTLFTDIISSITTTIAKMMAFIQFEMA